MDPRVSSRPPIRSCYMQLVEALLFSRELLHKDGVQKRSDNTLGQPVSGPQGRIPFSCTFLRIFAGNEKHGLLLESSELSVSSMGVLSYNW